MIRRLINALGCWNVARQVHAYGFDAEPVAHLESVSPDVPRLDPALGVFFKHVLLGGPYGGAVVSARMATKTLRIAATDEDGTERDHEYERVSPSQFNYVGPTEEGT